MTSHDMANQMGTDIFMRRERRRLQARHIWKKIAPNWPMIEERVWTKQATGLPYQALYRRLFLQEYAEESRWRENSCKGPHLHWIRQQWQRSMGRHSVSSQTWSNGCFVMAMDWLPWGHSWTGMAHTAGSIPTQTTTGCEGWSHARPVKASPRTYFLMHDLFE